MPRSQLQRAFEACARQAQGNPRADVRLVRDEQLAQGFCIVCGAPLAWHRDPFSNQSLGCIDVDAAIAEARRRLTFRAAAGVR